MKIRAAAAEDAGILALLNSHVHAIHAAHRPDVYRVDPPVDELTDYFAALLVKDVTRAFIAEIDRPVGYAVAAVVRREENPFLRAESFILLDQLAVDPQAARRGVASQLIEAVRDAGRREGCQRLLTDVLDFNKDAKAFYAAAGFAELKHVLEQPL
ncbi:GNAT family N-acetyltransferase [Nonomuraea phyllanthi]|uniref:GNAT family N-acetyltransferase n=1 Tax=Nonomuraea phyllanthi TaxID=2219224 RepID=UPI001293A094|nr:GNAT family N-acetyltransferase [Nonomuraea phyllanthi]QFY10175.1 GNAT family N-acetyltransferase [Nonomuraea phyllanthi]